MLHRWADFRGCWPYTLLTANFSATASLLYYKIVQLSGVSSSGIIAGCVIIMLDATRRRERLRRLLAAIQSNVQPNKSRSPSRTTAAFVSMTTAIADNDADDVGMDGEVGPFVTRDRAMSFTSMHRRRRRSILRRGIVCECCVHRCDIDELQGYCGNSPSNWWSRLTAASTLSDSLGCMSAANVSAVFSFFRNQHFLVTVSLLTHTAGTFSKFRSDTFFSAILLRSEISESMTQSEGSCTSLACFHVNINKLMQIAISAVQLRCDVLLQQLVVTYSSVYPAGCTQLCADLLRVSR